MPALHVEGLAELRRAFKYVDQSAPKELAAMHHRAGDIVAEEARRRAPRGPHEGGGAITSIVASIKSAAQQKAVVVQAGGPRTPHAAVYEFGGAIPRRGHGGASPRARRQLGANQRTRIKKRGYLYPAVDAMMPRLERDYMEMLDGVLARFAQ